MHQCLKHTFKSVFLAMLLTACNNQSEQYPPGTQVTIAPSAFTWTVTEVLDDQEQCVFYPEEYQDTIMVITVKDSMDRPIGEMKLELYLSPSNSTSNPIMNNQHVFYLYDDFNSNGVVDHPGELVSGSGAPILYETKTEEYHGTKTVIVRTNTSCGGYRATLHAYAGDGYGSMEINTESDQDNEDVQL